MDSDFWTSRLAAAKRQFIHHNHNHNNHLNSQLDRLNFDDFEVEEDKGGARKFFRPGLPSWLLCDFISPNLHIRLLPNFDMFYMSYVKRKNMLNQLSTLLSRRFFLSWLHRRALRNHPGYNPPQPTPSVAPPLTTAYHGFTAALRNHPGYSPPKPKCGSAPACRLRSLCWLWMITWSM